MIKKIAYSLFNSGWAVASLTLLLGSIALLQVGGTVHVVPPPHEELLPGYYRTEDGVLVDSMHPPYLVRAAVQRPLPYLWFTQVQDDEEFQAWLGEQIGVITEEAHSMGVTGHTDRKLFWESKEGTIQQIFMEELSERYQLVPITKAAE